MGRATQGVRLINLEKRNDQIGSVCKVESESDEESLTEVIEGEDILTIEPMEENNNEENNN
jgi:DNA gyrase subunit A